MNTLNCNGRLLKFNSPCVMGIINTTPDSFYAGSRNNTIDDILKQAAKMIEDGATIIDIGGESSRPGSEPIGVEEELNRVIKPIIEIKKRFPEIFISIDTYRSKTAWEAVHAGADMVNDISAGCMDENLFDSIAKLKVPYILMHMQGRPNNMQTNPTYKNVVTDVLDFFIEKINILLQKNITDIIIDPGIGFGKTVEQNFSLIKNLYTFNILEKPIMIGVSRKSIIYKTLNTTPEASLNGTTILNTLSLLNGANILRVHDVKEAMECIKMVGEINNCD